MKKLVINTCKRYITDESGATAIEYGLLAALFGVGIIAGASTVAKDTNSLWNQVSNAVADVDTTP